MQNSPLDTTMLIYNLMPPIWFWPYPANPTTTVADERKDEKA